MSDELTYVPEGKVEVIVEKTASQTRTKQVAQYEPYAPFYSTKIGMKAVVDFEKQEETRADLTKATEQAIQKETERMKRSVDSDIRTLGEPSGSLVAGAKATPDESTEVKNGI